MAGLVVSGVRCICIATLARRITQSRKLCRKVEDLKLNSVPKGSMYRFEDYFKQVELSVFACLDTECVQRGPMSSAQHLVCGCAVNDTLNGFSQLPLIVGPDTTT